VSLGEKAEGKTCSLECSSLKTILHDKCDDTGNYWAVIRLPRSGFVLGCSLKDPHRLKLSLGFFRYRDHSWTYRVTYLHPVFHTCLLLVRLSALAVVADCLLQHVE
jgi:hypothetical protein